MGAAPIFVMSFNRPNYLEKVLQSLAAQKDANIHERQIVLFQDGAVNAYSGERYANDDDIISCVRIFEKIFPNGSVKLAPTNLGVALNFDRAEKFGFEQCSARYAIFLEDDLLLSDFYICTVEQLAHAFGEDERVGYVAAYGDVYLNREQQIEQSRDLRLLYHNWGFALFRRHWLRTRPYVEQYLEIVGKTDYRRRDSAAIRRLYASWGFEIPESSQDVAKTLACCIENIVKINTTPCFAKYIGEVGLHMSPTQYEKIGYANTVVYDKKVPNFEPLSEGIYNDLLAEQLAWARPQGAHRHSATQEILKSPDMVAPETVEESLLSALYRILLHRSPDESGLGTHLENLHAGKSIEATIRSFIASEEFNKKHPLAAQEFRCAFQVQELRAAQAVGPVRLVIGAATTCFSGWVSTDRDFLDLLKPETWSTWLTESSVEAMLAEHVWEHLDSQEALAAAQTCHRFLAPGKRIRVAVPDALMPDPGYRQLCKIGNQDGHKSFFDYRSLSNIFLQAKFDVELLEYWTEDGSFHEKKWNPLDGEILRSRYNDRRNSNEKIVYTSLIIDAVKRSI